MARAGSGPRLAYAELTLIARGRVEQLSSPKRPISSVRELRRATTARRNAGRTDAGPVAESQDGPRRKSGLTEAISPAKARLRSS